MTSKFTRGAARAAWLGASALSAAFAVPAFAQDAQDESGCCGADDSAIVVTAQRREERLVDVPISVSSISAAKLESSGTSSVINLPQTTTGLRMDYSGPYVQPTIRGVGSPLVGPGLNSNVAVYFDGFYVPNPLGTDFQLLSVKGVQVLKGPQGTLFGRNATGGAILVTTADPSFDTSLTAKASYASFDKLNVGGYVTGALGANVAADLTGFYERGDGYITNINTGKKVSQYDKWAIRPKLLIDLSDSAQIIASYQHSEVNDPLPFLTSSYDGLTSASAYSPGITVAQGPTETSNGDPAKSTLNSDLATLTGKFDLGFAKLTSYTQYRDDKSQLAGDYDGTAFPVMAPDWQVWDKTFTQEFNLSSPAGSSLSWVLGAFYYHNTNEYPGYNVSVFASPKFEYFRSKSKTESFATFADATYEVVPSLFLTGGLRYSIDKVQGSFLCTACGGLTGDGEKTFKKLTPRVNLRYQIEPSTNIYASYNAGYKAGFIPVSAFATTPIKPEKIDAFEVGFKTVQGPVRFDASTFYYVYKDLQVAAYIGSAAVYRNAAKSEIYGADAQITFDVTPDLSLSLSGTYTHAQYKKFGNAVDYVQDLNPLSPSFGLFVHPDVNVDGNVMPRSPEFSGNVSANWKHDFDFGRLAFDANFFHTTKFYFDSPKRFSQGAYSLLNLRGTWTSKDGHYAVSVFGTNVTDAKYRIQVLPGDFAIQQVYGEPASVGVSLTVNY